MLLRHHQQVCLSKIDNVFENDNKGLIKMFCGSGKSFIIYNCLLKYSNSLSVVVVPSINLITQFNKDYLLNEDKKKYNKKYFNKDFELLTICSKNDVDKELKTDFTFTTDEDEILEFLEIEENKIILITYQSLATLTNIIKEYEFEIDLMCFDEAHHILSDGMKKLLFGTEYDDNESDEITDFTESFIDTYVNKSLFFTATPKNSNGIKMYEPFNEIEIDNEYFDIIDDEDTYYQEESHCGDMIYEYMHIDGVNDNILNDFNIRIDLYTDDTDTSVYEAIFRTVLETGNSRILTFHSRSTTKSDKSSDVITFTNISMEKLKEIYKKVRNEFNKPKHIFKNITVNYITAESKDKMEILNDFDNCPDNEIYILASCKTIGEGVDTKNANMVVFVDPKQSYVDIIQNIGRVCRKNENTKALATVLIPAFVDVKKYKDCKTVEEKDIVIRNEMSKTGNFNGILNVLSALRQEDRYMFELCLKYPHTYQEKEINDNLKKNGLECDKEITKEKLFEENKLKYDESITEKENFDNLSDKLKKNIQIINNKVLEEDVFIDGGYKEIIHFVKKGDNYVKTKGKNNKKIEKSNRNIKPFVHTNKEIQILWEIDSDVSLNKKIFGGYIKSTVIGCSIDDWMNMLEKVKKYIDENGKRPAKESKNNIVKKIGIWLGTQIYTHKRNISIMKNIKIRNCWETFIKNYNEYFITKKDLWLKNFIELEKFINDNKIIPSISLISDFAEKKIFNWMCSQKQNYNQNRGFVKDENLKKKWVELIKKYPQIIKSHCDIWFDRFKDCEDYVKKNNSRPPKGTAEYRWITTNIVSYNKNTELMKYPDIKKKWEIFMKNYKTIFITNDDKWFNNFKKFEKYIIDEKKFPNSKNDETKFLAKWWSHQEEKILNKKLDEKKISIINKIIKEYPEIFKKNNDIWNDQLKELKNFINENKKLPSQSKKDTQQDRISKWMQQQKMTYIKNDRIMKSPEIRSQWENFITEYQDYFPDNPAIKKPSYKSTTIKPKEPKEHIETEGEKIKRVNSWYSEFTNKMSIQKSTTTNKMFRENNSLWYKYHDNRDFSFKGYDKQDEIPVNKIIRYLEQKKNKKLKILDLGCGRNLIKEYFKDNISFDITGYDYVSFNGSIECDISNLPEESEIVDICIFSQSLMGSNWQEYLKEALRVLRYNGEMIISESEERYEIIKKYICELGCYIIKDDYNEKNRWFYLFVINNKM
jgi:ribosomal RNA-processing protein 8